MPKKKLNKNTDYSTTIKYIFTLLICLPIIISPFMRGLFFEKEFLKISIYTSIIFLMFLLFYKKMNITLFDRKFDWAILGFFVAYILSCFNAAYIRDALLEVAKIGTYFLIYLVISRVANNEKNKNLILTIIFLTGVLVALTGISSQIKLIEFVGAYIGERIHTTIQYPNSAAAYLSAILFIGFYLWNYYKDKTIHSLCYSIGNFTLLYTIIGTQSRGGWLILIFFIVAFILIFDEQKNILLTKITLISFFSLSAYILIGQRTGFSALLVLLLVVLVLSIFIYLLHKNEEVFNFKLLKTRRIVLLVLTGCILLSVGLYTYATYEKKSINLLKNSEFTKGSLVYWGLNGNGGEKREVVFEENFNWINISKNDVKTDSWGIYQLIDEFKPNMNYTLSFDAYSEMPDGKLWIVIHQVGSDGNTPYKSTVIDINEKKRYQYTFTTDDLDQKEQLRVFFLLPNDKNQSNIYLTKVQLEEGSTANEYVKNKYKNQQILKFVDRIKAINFNQNSVHLRYAFYKDAIKMFKDKPLLGFGGGGWENAYYKFQSFSYYTKTIHNHFLQVLVETGIVGFIFWCSIWIILLLNVFSRRELKVFKKIDTTIFISLFTLGAHNLIDFTFSLGAITIFYFSLLGLTNLQTDNRGILNRNRIITIVSAITVLIFTITISIWFNSSDNELVKFQMERGYPIDINKVKKDLKTDFLNAHYNALMAEVNFQMYEKDNNQEFLIKALDYINRAIKLDRYNYKWPMWKSKYLLAKNDFEGFEEFSNKAINLAPMQAIPYEDTAALLFKVYKELKEKGDIRYKEYEEGIYKVDLRGKDIVQSVPKEQVRAWQGVRPDESQVIKDILDELNTNKSNK